MSMPVNHIRSLLLTVLPLLLGVIAVGIAVWLGVQTKPLSAGSGLTLHQALTNLPSQSVTDDVGVQNQLEQFQGIDPFFRLKKEIIPTKGVEQEVTLEELHLSSIAEGKGGRYCLLNNQIYHEGQTGKGFKITQISPNRVHFTTSVESFTLVPGQKAAIEGGKLVPFEKELTKISASPSERTRTETTTAIEAHELPQQ